MQQNKTEDTRNPLSKTPTFTGKELWNVYRKSVKGKNFKGQKLPQWALLGDAQKDGWNALAEYIGSELK